MMIINILDIQVSIPDDRLNKLGKLASSQKVVGAQVKFVDVAGLVRGYISYYFFLYLLNLLLF